VKELRVRGGFRLHNRRWYPWLFAVLCIAVVGGALLLGSQLRIEVVVSALGGAGGVTAFLYTQHLQETRLFTELFQSFNKRYDELNERLNEIAVSAAAELGSNDRQVLMDYFNLCGEEYLYFSAGYIDRLVWSSWVNGMSFYAAIPAIRTFWEQELKGGSYYDFSLDELS
jgi:hypothetical protein